jgi:hypothetical protein
MTGAGSSPSGVRLAELLAVLSLGSDLGMGYPMEHAMRQCLIAMRLGQRLGLDRAERASLYHVSLLAWGVMSMPMSRPSGSVTILRSSVIRGSGT